MVDTTEWGTGTLEERVDRVESLAQIRLLASRYALALDSRNMDEMVALFPEDVQVGPKETGRDAMRRWFVASFSNFRASIHQVMNHVIDLDDADHAHGVVYCRDEIERLGRWDVGVIQYWDTYERRDRRWYFKRRKLMRWYMVDALTRPSYGARPSDETSPLRQGQLPEVWPSWDEFWEKEATQDLR